MSNRWLWVMTVGLALSAGTLQAQPLTLQPQGLTPSVGVREVSASERRLIPLSTKIRYTTLIILPEEEEILDVVCGDKEFWVINAAHHFAHV
jgi:hypothetical protein